MEHHQGAVLTWLGLLNAILTLAGSLAGILRDNRLMEAGAANATIQAVRNAQTEIERAKAARRASDTVKPGPGGMPDDGFRRD